MPERAPAPQASALAAALSVLLAIGGLQTALGQQDFLHDRLQPGTGARLADGLLQPVLAPFAAAIYLKHLAPAYSGWRAHVCLQAATAALLVWQPSHLMDTERVSQAPALRCCPAKAVMAVYLRHKRAASVLHL